jgi:Family of unknown function (DUF6157)
MKIHTTNYTNTFIVMADDCPVQSGEVPAAKAGTKTIAEIQYEMIANHPYRYTSDEVLFQVFANRKDLTEEEYEEARAQFFSKGQPCFRASPLTKRYGWGVHFDKEGKMALFGAHTLEYQKLMQDPDLTILKAMKASR